MTFFETFMNIISGLLVWGFAAYILIKILRTAYQILAPDGGD